MKVVYCREEFGYNFEEFACLLFPNDETNADEVTDILTRLKRVNVISKVKVTRDVKNHKSDLSDIDDDVADVLEIDSSAKETLYKFKFVGLIVVKSFIIYCFPKYIEIDYSHIPSDIQFAEFKQVIKVIEKYSKSNREQEIYSLYDIDESFAYSDMSVSLFLLEDFFLNGLYSHQESIIENNGEGEILWDKTVNESFAFFTDNRPIYLDYFNRRSVVEDDNLIKKLHEIVLSRISRTLEENGLLELLDLTQINFTDANLIDLGDLDYILYVIESELSQEFNTRKQLLLKALYSYISQKYVAEKAEFVTLFGTNSYRGIWETVCAKVLNDKLDVTIYDVSLEPTGTNTKHTRIKNIIDKPQWIQNEDKCIETATLIPDIITVFNNKLLILDGKYYNLKFDTNTIAGNPGVGDVTKQFLYALAYREFAEKNNLVIENYFLMPTETETDLNFAQVEMQLLNNLGLSSVKVAKLNAPNIYHKYLNDELDQELLSKF